MTPTDTCATGASRRYTCAVSRWVARIAELVGRRDPTVMANTYPHVLVDEGELENRFGRFRTTGARARRSRRLNAGGTIPAKLLGREGRLYSRPSVAPALVPTVSR
jgi:hypothetical protein